MIKRLSSKKEEERKHKRNQWILGIILTVVMFGSVFGIVVNSFDNSEIDQNIIEYNGYKFIPEGAYFTTQIGTSKFYFSFGPAVIDALEKEVSISKTLSAYPGKTIYLHSENSPSSTELYQNLVNYVSRIQPACKANETCLDENYPLKDCTSDFILIKESDENKIYEDQNCVYIEGKKEDLLKLTDEFIMQLIGIK